MGNARCCLLKLGSALNQQRMPRSEGHKPPLLTRRMIGAKLLRLRSLPSDVDCVLNSVNKVLELHGLPQRLTKQGLCEAQAPLIHQNPAARVGAYGDPPNHSEGPSFTIAVVLRALRDLLPGHHITIRNLCKRGGSIQAVLQDIARSFKKKKTKRGSRRFLIDGILNSEWKPDECSKYGAEAWHKDPTGWRHMVMLDEKRSKMYDHQAGSYDEWNVVGSAGELDPILCNARGDLPPPNSPTCAPWLAKIHKIYEFDIKLAPPLSERQRKLKRVLRMLNGSTSDVGIGAKQFLDSWRLTSAGMSGSARPLKRQQGCGCIDCINQHGKKARLA